MPNVFTKFACIAVIASMMLFNVSVPLAKAGMISTQAVVSASQDDANREVVRSFLQRADLQEVLVDRGIDVSEAQARVDALTDQEAAMLAERIENLPAGANAVGVVVGAAVFIFVVLLITDILGLTDVFPFVNR